MRPWVNFWGTKGAVYCRLALETDSPEHWLFCELYDAVRIPQVTSVEGIVTIEFLLNVQEFPTRITRTWQWLRRILFFDGMWRQSDSRN